MRPQRPNRGTEPIAVLLAALPAGAALFFDRGTPAVFEPAKVQLFQAGTVSLATAYLIHRLKSDLLHLKRWPLALPVLALNGILVLTLPGSLAFPWSVWGSYERAQGILMWLSLGLFAYLIYQYRAESNFADRLIGLLVGSSAAVVGYAAIQALGLDPWTWRIDEGTSSIFGTLGRSNYLAGYLVLVIPLTLERFGRARRPWLRFGLGLLISMQLVTLYLSKSRAGGLATIATAIVGGIGWVILRHPRVRRILGPTLVALAVVGMLAVGMLWRAPKFLRQRIDLPTTSSLRGSDAARLTIWRACGALIAQRPLLGFGPGTFPIAFARAYPPELVYYEGREVMIDHAHNLWIHMGVESGILGAAGLLSVNLLSWGVGVRHLIQIKTPRAQFRQLTFLLSLFAVTLMDLLQPPTATTLVTTWALYSLILPPPNPEEPTHDLPRMPIAFRRVGTFVLLCTGVAFIGLFFLRPMRADHLLNTGFQHRNFSALLQAEALMPRRDAYFHKVGRFATELSTENGFVLAESQFQRAVELCPNHPLYWADLGTLYLAWSQHEGEQTLEKAEDAFLRALSINPNQALWLHGLGRAYAQQGKWLQAITVLEKTVELDETDAQAHLQLGDVYYRTGRYSDAVLAYGRAKREWPESAIPLAGIGRAYSRLDRCEKAVSYLEQSLQIEPTGPLTYQALAHCYDELGLQERAIRTLEEGARLYPQSISIGE